MTSLIIFGLLILLMLTGMPISIALGLTVLTVIYTMTNVPTESVALKLFTGIDIAKALTKPLGEQLANPLGLVLAQKPIVDEDADESFFDCLVNQSRSHGRIDAAAETTKHPAVADLFADPVNPSLDEVLHGPGRLTTANAKDEVLENFLAPRRMRHFRMKLNTEKPPARISKGRNVGIAAVGKHLPSLGHRRHLIAMAHPDSDQLVFAKSAKQVGVVIDC